MKPFLFDVMKGIIGDAKCEFIGEIGTHKGSTAKQFIALLAPRVKHLTYYGYDIFDGGKSDAVFHKNERNGKAPVALYQAESTLQKTKKLYRNITHKLHKGLTTDTMTPTKFDFVYIDGGHSYETVKHDYSMVKDSTLIVFDDFKITGINAFIKELIAEGVDVEIVRTASKHTWAVIRN
jgi:hypothetical protein|tara:strand:+ start:4192 stop:4728 length:537 start_codon:yes stop_codon:yes gene_type:complete